MRRSCHFHMEQQIRLFLLHFGITPALRTSGQGQKCPAVAAAQARESLQLRAQNLLDRKPGVDV